MPPPYTLAQEALFKAHSHLSYPSDDEDDKYIFLAYREDTLSKSFKELKDSYKNMLNESSTKERLLGKIELLEEMIAFLNHFS